MTGAEFVQDNLGLFVMIFTMTILTAVVYPFPFWTWLAALDIGLNIFLLLRLLTCNLK